MMRQLDPLLPPQAVSLPKLTNIWLHHLNGYQKENISSDGLKMTTTPKEWTADKGKRVKWIADTIAVTRCSWFKIYYWLV